MPTGVSLFRERLAEACLIRGMTLDAVYPYSYFGWLSEAGPPMSLERVWARRLGASHLNRQPLHSIDHDVPVGVGVRHSHGPRLPFRELEGTE